MISVANGPLLGNGFRGVFRQPLLLAELLHGRSAALLRCDSFGPLVGFRVARLRFENPSSHAVREAA